MGKTHLTRFWNLASADQSRIGDRMVRTPERTGDDQRTPEGISPMTL